jgi:hypothetical protein
MPDRVGDLLAALRALPEPPKLIVFDTLSRMMDGGEENSNDDMNRVANAGGLLQRETGAHVMFIHHKPKNGTSMRGGSALFGAVDTAIELVKEEASQMITVTCKKQKDGAEPFPTTTLRLSPVLLDAEQGLSSCVLMSMLPGERIDTFSPNTHFCLQTFLEQFGQEGATWTQWMQSVRLPKQTFVDACKPLTDQEYILRPETPRQNYRPTRKAWDWYDKMRTPHGTERYDVSTETDVEASA